MILIIQFSEYRSHLTGKCDFVLPTGELFRIRICGIQKYIGKIDFFKNSIGKNVLDTVQISHD